MSNIPEVDKSKYNKDDKFSWVDSQWEKFMTEQKEHKAIIKQLRADLITCNEHFQKRRGKIEDLENEVEQLKQDHYFEMRNKNLEVHTIREQMRQLVERVPSKYLTKGKDNG